MKVLFLFQLNFLFFSNFILCQILNYPRDEPILYSLNKATECCQYNPSSSSSSSSSSSNTPSHSSNSSNSSSENILLLFNCLNNIIKLNKYKKYNISIVSYITNNILKYGTLSAAINMIYSLNNNYKFSIETPETGSEYFPEDQRWNKVKILQEAINPDYGWAKDSEYIVWLDSDLIFLDLGMKIEDIGLKYPTSHIIMSEDVDLTKQENLNLMHQLVRF